jgi:hypothetical protein
VRPYWTVPVRADPERVPLDLKEIAWPRSILTNSVSDLLSPVRSRSYGRKNEGGGAHREDVIGEVSAALEVDDVGDLGVLDDGEVWDDIHFEVAEALAKRRCRKFPAATTRGGRRLVP